MYEFDLKTLWSTILGKKKMIVVNLLLALVIGVVVAISIPKIYVSQVELVAELKSGNNLGGAASLASFAGIKMDSGEDAVVPELYPNIMSSNKFLVDLMGVRVQTKDGAFNGSYREYLNTQSKVAWWSYPLIWFKGLFSSKNEGEIEKKTLDPESLSAEDFGIISGIKASVQCDVSSSDGLIKIVARAQDPLVAKMLVDSATTKLQDFVVEYRTNKARVDLRYYQKLAKDALEKYRDAQRIFAAYADSHKGLSSSAYLVEQSALENDVQLAFSTYSQTVQQVQMAQAKVQENTPVFTTINAAAVPPTADSPKKKLIVLAVVFLTIIGTLGWIYFSLLFQNTRK